jgi:hypothetical protein
VKKESLPGDDDDDKNFLLEKLIAGRLFVFLQEIEEEWAEEEEEALDERDAIEVTRVSEDTLPFVILVVVVVNIICCLLVSL